MSERITEAQSLTRVLGKASKELDELIDDLLGQPKEVPHKAPKELDELIDEVLDLIRPF